MASAGSTVDKSVWEQFKAMTGWQTLNHLLTRERLAKAYLSARCEVDRAWKVVLMELSIEGHFHGKPALWSDVLAALSSGTPPAPSMTSPATIIQASTKPCRMHFHHLDSPVGSASCASGTLTVSTSPGRTVTVQNLHFPGPMMPEPKAIAKRGANRLVTSTILQTYEGYGTPCPGGVFCCFLAFHEAGLEMTKADEVAPADTVKSKIPVTSVGGIVSGLMMRGYTATVVPDPTGTLRAVIPTATGLAHVPCSRSTSGSLQAVYPAVTDHDRLIELVRRSHQVMEPVYHENGALHFVRLNETGGAGPAVVFIHNDGFVIPVASSVPLTTPYGPLFSAVMPVHQYICHLTEFPPLASYPPRIQGFVGGDGTACLYCAATGTSEVPQAWSRTKDAQM